MKDNLVQELNELEEKIKLLNSLSKYRIEIGVIAGKSEKRKREKKFFISVGLTNAELMFIHENGSPGRNIPDRPVLKLALTDAADSMLPAFFDMAQNGVMNENWDRQRLELELDRFCMRLQNYARDIIKLKDSRLKANSPSVAKRKKGNYPLHNTGQLERSIVCRYVKK